MSGTLSLLNNSYVHLHCASVSDLVWTAHISSPVLKLFCFFNTENMYCSCIHNEQTQRQSAITAGCIADCLNNWNVQEHFLLTMAGETLTEHSLRPLQQTSVTMFYTLEVYSTCWKCGGNRIKHALSIFSRKNRTAKAFFIISPWGKALSCFSDMG